MRCNSCTPSAPPPQSRETAALMSGRRQSGVLKGHGFSRAVTAGEANRTLTAAARSFLDAVALTFADPDHSAEEEREITVGLSVRQPLVLVSQCHRGERTRLISAR